MTQLAIAVFGFQQLFLSAPHPYLSLIEAIAASIASLLLPKFPPLAPIIGIPTLDDARRGLYSNPSVNLLFPFGGLQGANKWR